MRLLALDAALGPCSAALLSDGRCLGVRDAEAGRSATASLPGLVQELLAAHPGGFAAVAVTVGPGSFTGLRGALALANGLALGSGVPVVGVTVAEAMLADASDTAAWVAIDSRRAGRLFLSCGGAFAVASLDRLPVPPQPVTVFGDAAEPVVEALRRAGAGATTAGTGRIDPCAVSRVALRRLKGALPPCAVQPLYLEPPEARAAPLRRPAPA